MRLSRLAVLPLVLALFASAAPAAPRRAPLPTDLPLAGAGPDSFLVEYTTTKGRFVTRSVRAWAPLGVDRYFHLVNGGYYDGRVIYRVGETKSVKGGRVVQFGQTGDTLVDRAWERATLADEPAVHPRRAGAGGFARGGPATRSTEMAFTTNEATALDTVSWQGVTGFPVVAVVVEGLDVLTRFEGRWGNAPIESDSLSIAGLAWLEQRFPGLDRIQRARVLKRWGGVR